MDTLPSRVYEIYKTGGRARYIHGNKGRAKMGQYILTARGSEEFRIVSVELLGRPSIGILCPWHSEVTPSCAISPDRGLFYCFGCKASGQCHRSGEMDDEELLQEYRSFEARDRLSHIEKRANSQQWWDAYRQYLTTTEWRERRWRVMQRAGYICEGCGTERATQVHHLTYDRVGREMLFDLVAICDDCHHSIHEK